MKTKTNNAVKSKDVTGSLVMLAIALYTSPVLAIAGITIGLGFAIYAYANK
jgi:hypothetical protein